MSDVLLVTVESLRYDHREYCPVFDDLQTTEAVTMGHYTRPSLAGLLSGQYRGALNGAVEAPSLPSVFRDAGYETIGVSYSPQTVPALDFDHGFSHFANDGNEERTLGRGSELRERLGEWRTIRALHRRVAPKHATLRGLPTDDDVVEEALDRYGAAEAPVFLWVHLMDSHRPYGRDDALPKAIGRKAAAAAPGGISATLTDTEDEEIRYYYRRALERASGYVERLIDGVADDAEIVVAGDHGEELGEDGYYFHGPYRRRVTPTLTRVPLGSTLDLDTSLCGLVDVAPTLADAVGIEPPDEWDGVHASESRRWLTMAPWAGKASVAYTTPGETIQFHDGDPSSAEAAVVSAATKSQLSALGYR